MAMKLRLRRYTICWKYEDEKFALRHNEGRCLSDDCRNARTFAIGQNPIFLNWNIDFIANILNYYLQWAIVVILTFGLSWILAFCISKLPFGDYIIGYKQVK